LKEMKGPVEQQIGPTNTGPKGRQMIAQDVVLGRRKNICRHRMAVSDCLLHDAG
jgi:hypothetical protein